MLVERQIASLDAPLLLDSGRELATFHLAYEAYGHLSAGRDNVVLLCHTLTGDAHAAGCHAEGDRRAGWWDALIGPGRMLDTDRYFILCSNVLGGCFGSTGPASIDPATGTPFGMRFPVLTVADMVRAQRRLLDRLGIARLQAVIGGCLGGMQAMEWGRLFPGDIDRLVVIGATAATSAHTLGLWHTVRRCIMDDPDWKSGDYYEGSPPAKGLGLSMMLAMLLWMGRDGFAQRFGRRLAGAVIGYGFDADFEAERFLDGIAASAGAKFDPNSLLYLTRAMDYFDLTGGITTLEQALSPLRASTLLVSYRSDWRYPPEEMEPIRVALAANGVSARHCILDSPLGHGAFLHDPSGLAPVVRDFLSPSLIAALTS